MSDPNTTSTIVTTPVIVPVPPAAPPRTLKTAKHMTWAWAFVVLSAVLQFVVNVGPTISQDYPEIKWISGLVQIASFLLLTLKHYQAQKNG